MTPGQQVEWVNGIHVKGVITKVDGDTFDVQWNDDWTVKGYGLEDIGKNISFLIPDITKEIIENWNNENDC